MAVSRDVHGQPASPGMARGPAHVAADPMLPVRRQDNVVMESQRLVEAVRTAIAALEALGRRSDAVSADILDFQIELLEDDAILSPAQQRIAAGASAASAWAAGLDAHIAGIEGSDDAMLAARAIDVIDIRNRVLEALSGRAVADFPEGSIFVARDIAPSLFLAHDWSKGGGIALTAGSTASHVALLARAKAVPMVVGLSGLAVEAGEMLLLDGTHGRVVVNPTDAGVDPQPATMSAETPQGPVAGDGLRTADGRPVGLWLNINDAADFERIDPAVADGVGLVRTEFLLAAGAEAMTDDRQYEAYRRILDWAGERPVTIRMLDLGGDKAMPGLGGGEQDGSFLGARGIRLLLARPGMARTQARALLRAGVHGNLRVLLPMVTVPSELSEMMEIFAGEAAYLDGLGVANAMPPIGIMVEVPAAALTLDLFGQAAFFSFGTNDLVQYISAASRDNSDVAALHEQVQPALLRILKLAVDAAGRLGVPVSICGDLASDPARIAGLLSVGLRDFSVASARLMAIRAAVSRLNADRRGMGHDMAREVIEDDAVIAYKTVLAAIIDNRPSGTRQRLATALGKHRSFVTQVTSPAYSTPLPARHLATIFKVCHFSPAEQARFLAAYQLAHPGKLPEVRTSDKVRHISLPVPDLGDERKNRELDEAISDFVQRIASLTLPPD